MKSAFVLVVFSYVVYTKALDCGLMRLNNDQLKKVFTECVKDNQTVEKLWDLIPQDSIEEDGSMSSEEQIPITKGLGNTRNMKQVKSSRTKRSRGGKFNSDSTASSKQRRYGGSGTSTTEETTTLEDAQSEEENTKTNKVYDYDDVCILQCVFDKLEITDSNGLPDHKKLVEVFLKSTTGREMRDFVQDSTDECFQEMSQESSENPCQYSGKLLTCLAEKGKSNCEDWPTGDIPLL